MTKSFDKVRVSVVILLLINAFIAGISWGVLTNRMGNLEARVVRQEERIVKAQDQLRVDMVRGFDRLNRKLDDWLSVRVID